MRRLTVALVMALATFGLFGFALPVSAGSGPTFGVQNTSETPPDGVYFRFSPHQTDYQAIWGFGVFAGEKIQSSCWSWGDAVGPFSNKVWYQAFNLTRPTVSGRVNAGWINTHYVADNMTANNPSPSVPQCGVSTTPPPVSTPAPTPVPTSVPVQTPKPAQISNPTAAPTQQPSTGNSLQGGSGNAAQNPTTQPIQGTGNSPKLNPAPAELPGGASVYYSPFFRLPFGIADGRLWTPNHLLDYQPSPATVTLYANGWQGKGGENSGKFENVIGGKRVTTLAGWSLGRVGILYFLHSYSNRAGSIDYLIFFDPASYKEMTSSDCPDVGDPGCSKGTISKELANWLSNPNHRILVLTGEAALDAHGEKGEYGGIKTVYFPAVHGNNRVSICSYGSMSHEEIWINFRYLIARQIPSSCPAAPGEKAPQIWHP